MNNYGFPQFDFSNLNLEGFLELSEVPEKNHVVGPIRRGRGPGVSADERTRRLQEKASQLLAACGSTDQEELNRVFHSLSTGRHFEHIQSYELRQRVEHWLNWEQ